MKDRIYYDGKCDFCFQMVNFLELDKTYELFDLHKVESVEAGGKVIKKNILEQEIHLITTNETILKGGYALREILNARGIVPRPLMRLLDNKFAGFVISLIYRYISNRRSAFNHLYQRVCSYSCENRSDAIKEFVFTIIPLFIFILFLNMAGSTIEARYIISASVSSFIIHQTLLFNWKVPSKKSPLGNFFYYTLVSVILIFLGLMGVFKLHQTLIVFVLITISFTRIQKKITILSLRSMMRIGYGLIGTFLFYVPPASTSPINISQICFWLVFFGEFHQKKGTISGNHRLKASETIYATSAIIKILIISFVFIFHLI